MKTAIFSFVKVSETSMVASVRITRWLSERLKVPVVDTGEKVKAKAKEGLDLLIIVNGAFAFCKHLTELRELVLASKRIVWLQQDYTIGPIPKPDSKGLSPFRAAFRERREAGLPDMDFWTTCEDWQSKTPASRYVNWNTLTFDPLHDAKVIAKRRKNANDYLFYYGSFRNTDGKKISRLKYFDRYFSLPAVPTKISSPSAKFEERYGQTCVTVDPIKEKFYEYIGMQGMGLYIEDVMSHLRFHSPANRFYEMLSAGLPMVFQPESEKMLSRAGYDVRPYIVKDAADIERLFSVREDIGRTQRKTWIGGRPDEFRGLLETQVDEAYAHQASLHVRQLPANIKRRRKAQ